MKASTVMRFGPYWPAGIRGTRLSLLSLLCIRCTRTCMLPAVSLLLDTTTWLSAWPFSTFAFAPMRKAWIRSAASLVPRCLDAGPPMRAVIYWLGVGWMDRQRCAYVSANVYSPHIVGCCQRTVGVATTSVSIVKNDWPLSLYTLCYTDVVLIPCIPSMLL